jgi:hypothetical protein
LRLDTHPVVFELPLQTSPMPMTDEGRCQLTPILHLSLIPPRICLPARLPCLFPFAPPRRFPVPCALTSIGGPEKPEGPRGLGLWSPQSNNNSWSRPWARKEDAL